ncbi:hypothetical protein ASC80_10505 [Afipia sp. Root123D2]|nr:hypothetical protein ASC80_10505 [Afipia sp. Root123D2]
MLELPFAMNSGHSIAGDDTTLPLKASNLLGLGAGEFQPNTDTATVLPQEYGSQFFKCTLNYFDLVRRGLFKIVLELLDC